MLNKLGIKTFYGQAYLPDICELSDKMLPYTEKYFTELITTGKIEKITPSDIWYMERIDFSEKKSMVLTEYRIRINGFELLQGNSKFSGQILGGCLETIYYNIFSNSRNSDSVEICRKYEIFPSLEDWNNKILLLETSENKISPELFRKMIVSLKEYGIFDVVNGVLVGKPQDNKYYHEYNQILTDFIDNKNLSIVCNINVDIACQDVLFLLVLIVQLMLINN